MERFAIFVDAGYIRGRAQTKRRLAGVPTAHTIVIDEEKLVNRLREFGERQSGEKMLRIYWYDGMPKTGMTAEHLRLAKLSDVKLRFGTLNNYGDQKGVDSRVIADMIELARNRAIDSAILVGGDEDLRVGIEVAQSYGVRFHILGLQDMIHANQSQLLQQEADTVTVWDRSETDTFIRFVAPSVLGAVVAAAAAPLPAPHLPVTATIAASATIIDASVAKLIDETAALYIATLDQQAKVDIQTVYESRSAIAAPYDGRTLGRCRAALGRDLEPYEKSYMRKALAEFLALSKPAGHAP